MALIVIGSVAAGILIGIGIACAAMIARCTSIDDAYERGREDGLKEARQHGTDRK